MTDSNEAPQAELEGPDPKNNTPLALKDYVVLVGGALSADFMTSLIAEAEASDAWERAGVGKQSAVRTDIRNCEQIPLLSSGPEWVQRYRKGFIRVIEECVKVYSQRFPNLTVRAGTDLQLLRYYPGGFYSEHIDHHPQMNRTLTLTFALNDAYEGGEMSFFNQRLVLNMKAGEVVMFPSNFLFPHGIQPIHSGVRYALVTWLH